MKSKLDGANLRSQMVRWPIIRCGPPKMKNRSRIEITVVKVRNLYLGGDIFFSDTNFSFPFSDVKPLVFPKESLINHWRGGANVSTDSSITNTLVPNVEKESSNSSKQCCSCKNEKIRPTDVEQKILFEDLIFNTVYVKKYVRSVYKKCRS